MYRVLIGEISSNKAIVIAKYIKLHYNDVEIYSYDYIKLTNHIHTKYVDKHFVFDVRGNNDYFEAISSLISEYNIDLFLPVHSDYIGKIIEMKSLFGNSLFYLGNYDEYEQLHQKDLLQKTARELNINTPRHFDNFSLAKIPFVGKPINKSSSKGVVYITKSSDIEKYNKHNFTDYIFQEYIKGFGCGYSVYAINGEIQIGYAHKRILEYPCSGGSSIYRETFHESEMKAAAEKILNKIKWTGFVMFEFKYTDDNRFVLIEANPRIWGSINQGLMNNVNYFSPIIPNSFEREVIMSDKALNTYMSPQICLSLTQYLLHFKLKKVFLFFKNMKSNIPDVSFTDDFKGYLSLLIRVFLK